MPRKRLSCFRCRRLHPSSSLHAISTRKPSCSHAQAQIRSHRISVIHQNGNCCTKRDSIGNKKAITYPREMPAYQPFCPEPAPFRVGTQDLPTAADHGASSTNFPTWPPRMRIQRPNDEESNALLLRAIFASSARLSAMAINLAATV